MKPLRRFSVALLLPLAGGACSDSPTTPSSIPGPALSYAFPGGTTFTIVSGETDLPVVGARFVDGGRELLTNENGQVSLTREVPFYSQVDIVAEGFLDRNTYLERDRTRYTLWPKASPTGLTEHATAEIVYTTSAVGEESVLGRVLLRRWRASLSQIEVVFGEGFESADATQLNTQLDAVAEFNSFLPPGISYSTPRFGSLPIRGYVELRIKPDYSYCIDYDASAVATLGEGEFERAQITYCSDSAARRKRTALHELGHTFGLRHSSDRNDIMHISSPVSRFHPRECLLMLLISQRRGGNRFPYDDRGAVRSSVRDSIDIVCY